jgi:GTPase
MIYPRVVGTIDMKKLSITNDKIVSLIDLAGHEKYLKTTVFGITGLFPDRGIIVIGANSGITKLTREHIGIMLCIKIPFIIIITKIDMAPPAIYEELKTSIKKLFHRNASNKTLYFVGNCEMDVMDDTIDIYIKNMISDHDVIPVITVSNKNGYNINNLHRIIYNIPQRDKFINMPPNGTVVYLDANFIVSGIGTVVSGMIKEGIIKPKQKMFMGPYNGEMIPIVIRSIHNNIREDVQNIGPNVQACFAIKFVDVVIPRCYIIKGMVLIDNIEKWQKNIIKTFIARIKVLHHSTSIKTGYCPTVHCGPIKQVATMKLLNEETTYLKSGDNELVSFTFKDHSEFMETNMIIFFRDGATKGVGEVISLVPPN